MKKIIIAIYCLLPLVGIGQSKFTLTGQLAQTTAADIIYLRYMSNSVMVVDSTQLIDGKFVFTGQLSSVTDAYLNIKHLDKTNNLCVIYLEPKEIKLKSPTRMLADAVVTGSIVNDVYGKYRAAIKAFTDQLEILNKEWIAKTKEERTEPVYRQKNKELLAAINKNMIEANKQFYPAHFDSYIGLVAYYKSGMVDVKNNLDATASEFNKFAPHVKQTDLGKSIGGMIDGALKTKAGLMAMDFTQNDVNGKPVKLSDFKGKYVLLDFWASWCGPCRAENPALIKAYANFKDKNFTILSVSLDQPGKRDAWLKAIESDGMVWTNVSDLKYWNNEAALKYGIKSIPANFLIDPSGKIIAKNLRGAEVEKVLAELVK